MNRVIKTVRFNKNCRPGYTEYKMSVIFHNAFNHAKENVRESSILAEMKNRFINEDSMCASKMDLTEKIM